MPHRSPFSNNFKMFILQKKRKSPQQNIKKLLFQQSESDMEDAFKSTSQPKPIHLSMLSHHRIDFWVKLLQPGWGTSFSPLTRHTDNQIHRHMYGHMYTQTHRHQHTGTQSHTVTYMPTPAHTYTQTNEYTLGDTGIQTTHRHSHT